MNDSRKEDRMDVTKVVPHQRTIHSIPMFGISTMRDYNVIQKIGEGTFGTVTKASLTIPGNKRKLVALKKINVSDQKSGFPITALREVVILKQLNHKNILPLIDLVVEPNSKVQFPQSKGVRHVYHDFFLVSPFMKSDLSGLLHNPNIKFTEPIIKCFLKQLLEGINYLHHQKYYHRDIKTANLLVDHNGILKIADFGLARKYYGHTPKSTGGPSEPKHNYTGLVVTRWYRAPELLLGDTRYTTAIDMWGVGCVFAEFFEHSPILKGTSDLEQLYLIFDMIGVPTNDSYPGYDKLRNPLNAMFASRMPPYLEKKYSKYFHSSASQTNGVSFLKSLLTLNPLKRLNAEQCLNHPYLNSPPYPMLPHEIPKFAQSHEMDNKRFKEERLKMMNTQKNTIENNSNNFDNNGYRNSKGYNNNSYNTNSYNNNNHNTKGFNNNGYDNNRFKYLPQQPRVFNNIPNGPREPFRDQRETFQRDVYQRSYKSRLAPYTTNYGNPSHHGSSHNSSMDEGYLKKPGAGVLPTRPKTEVSGGEQLIAAMMNGGGSGLVKNPLKIKNEDSVKHPIKKEEVNVKIKDSTKDGSNTINIHDGSKSIKKENGAKSTKKEGSGKYPNKEDSKSIHNDEHSKSIGKEDGSKSVKKQESSESIRKEDAGNISIDGSGSIKKEYSLLTKITATKPTEKEPSIFLISKKVPETTSSTPSPSKTIVSEKTFVSSSKSLLTAKTNDTSYASESTPKRSKSSQEKGVTKSKLFITSTNEKVKSEIVQTKIEKPIKRSDGSIKTVSNEEVKLPVVKNSNPRACPPMKVVSNEEAEPPVSKESKPFGRQLLIKKKSIIASGNTSDGIKKTSTSPTKVSKKKRSRIERDFDESGKFSPLTDIEDSSLHGFLTSQRKRYKLKARVPKLSEISKFDV